ncbi:MAG: hypothetical protein SNH88_06370 [Rikenellaceae bacterium]
MTRESGECSSGEFWLCEPMPQWAVLCQNSLFVSGAGFRELPPAGGDSTPAGAALSPQRQVKTCTSGGAIPAAARAGQGG